MSLPLPAYEIEMSGNWEEQLSKLRGFESIASPLLERAMAQSVAEIGNEVRPLTPVGVSGRLRNSIASEVRNEGGLSIVGRVGSTLRDEIYPVVMEFGRQPGTMPPPSALERWVHLKLGVPEGSAPAVAYQVARRIAQRGIPGKFFMQRGWEKAAERVQHYFSGALEAIAEALSVK